MLKFGEKLQDKSQTHRRARDHLVNSDTASTGQTSASTSQPGNALELFLISSLVLFLELACIRWFPAHVLYLTFFTNTVLLASFLGMSVGCLAASARRNYLAWTPALLVIALAAAHLVEISSGTFLNFVDVGHQKSPQMVFFGTEYHVQDLTRYAIPVEVLCGFFFLIIALSFVGPGQELGRTINRIPNRIRAYTLNIFGSLAGILLFAATSWLELSPFWWFLLVALGLALFYFISPRRPFPPTALHLGSQMILLVLVVWLASFVPSGNDTAGPNEVQQFWSPYYKIDFKRSALSLSVNLIYHQRMVSQSEVFPAYALPHLLNRDAGRPPFRDVLIIGAGSGNDVSRALQWGATHVDAVEIDPAIYRLGRAFHPDHPYQDNRVFVHLDDGRNFIRSTDRKYDLIVYALVDSLVLHSGYSNIRLESYLFTEQTFEDVRRHLKPDGIFVVYNYFRQGWIIARLQKGLEEVFGTGNPLLMTLPYRQTIEPEQAIFGDFTIFFAGDTGALRSAFASHPAYWLRNDQAPTPDSPNGFIGPAQEERVSWQQTAAGVGAAAQQENSPWQRFGLGHVLAPQGSLRVATDDWPFLYLHNPMIPTLSLRGAAIMAALALLLLLLFQPRHGRRSRRFGFDGRMFFLGAGFMLIETKAVVLMALLFGSTWVVNSIVFFAALLMILIANLWAIKFEPRRLWPYYAGLLLTLSLNAIIPFDFFLGMARAFQILGSCLLVFTPIFFAGVVFAASFKRAPEPDRAFGANIAGAMLGGLAEYSSMLIGFRYLVIVAILFYILSALFAGRGEIRAAGELSLDATPQ